MPGPGAVNALPSMQVGPPAAAAGVFPVIVAPASLTDFTVIVSPPAGSVNVAPTASAASLKLAGRRRHVEQEGVQPALRARAHVGRHVDEHPRRQRRRLPSVPSKSTGVRSSR